MGSSGSGKSTLLIDSLAKKYKDKVVIVDQTPLQGTSRGNAATYIGVFDKVRELISKQNNISKDFDCGNFWKLSQSELKVLWCVSQLKSVREIADILFISPFFR